MTMVITLLTERVLYCRRYRLLIAIRPMTATSASRPRGLEFRIVMFMHSLQTRAHVNIATTRAGMPALANSPIME